MNHAPAKAGTRAIAPCYPASPGREAGRWGERCTPRHPSERPHHAFVDSAQIAPSSARQRPEAEVKSARLISPRALARYRTSVSSSAHFGEHVGLEDPLDHEHEPDRGD